MLAAALGLSLTACTTTLPPMLYSLTVNVSGVPSANVTVMDNTTKQMAFQQVVTGSATIPNLTEGHSYTITGLDVTGFKTPNTQTLTLTKNEAVSLTYTAQ